MLQFSDTAYTKIMLHASIHSRTPVHGILLGQRSSDSEAATQIIDAIPVCHSHPTKPIIDMALRFVQVYCDDLDGMEIIGWYTANERLGDDSPSPIAWKVMNSIQKTVKLQNHDLSSDTILVMVHSKSFESMLKKEYPTPDEDTNVNGYGFEVYKSHDKKYLPEEITCKNGDDWSEISAKVSDICLADSVKLYDFEGHLDGGDEGLKESDWLRNGQVAKLV